jgi:hypothetical protein
MKPKDRLPDPRVPTSTMVALRAKFLETCGLEGVVDLEGVEQPESSFTALVKRLSVCGPVIGKLSFVIARVGASLKTGAHREPAINCLDNYHLPQLWKAFRSSASYRIQFDLYSYGRE